MTVRHFLTLNDCTPAELQQIIHRAIEMKQNLKAIAHEAPFKNTVMGMLFEKSSTRTRVSFEAGMAQLGGHAMFLSPNDIQLGRGEPIEDTAIVLSSMLDIIMVRTFGHERLEKLAEYSSVPVINALTDSYHPCQLLADMQTYQECRGSIQGKKVVWVGDGNNMCQSYMNAAKQFNFQLIITCPEGYEPENQLLDDLSSYVSVVRSPTDAVKDADLVVTDVWASMGKEEEQAKRVKAFADYQVNEALLDLTKNDALFMHCLPAHRGEEISENLLEHEKSVVWQEAENRLHAQKALIEFLLNASH
ncbi:MAG: ornithine carbamoyltransferase [Cellvibrionales bacterium]|nr:ornithine carbamoyltransferase [Cellvibrionales bacterium]